MTPGEISNWIYRHIPAPWSPAAAVRAFLAAFPTATFRERWEVYHQQRAIARALKAANKAGLSFHSERKDNEK